MWKITNNLKNVSSIFCNKLHTIVLHDFDGGILTYRTTYPSFKSVYY